MSRSILKPTLDDLFGGPFAGTQPPEDVRDQVDSLPWDAEIEDQDELPLDPPSLPGLYFAVAFRPTYLGEEPRVEVCRATFLVRMAEAGVLAWLECRIIIEEGSIRHRLRMALEAAREHCRSAIGRVLALIRLDILLKLGSILATEALDLIRDEPQPRVLSAGGKDRLHIPLN